MTQSKALRIADDLDARKVEPQAASALRILNMSSKEGWRYADELEQERQRLVEVCRNVYEVWAGSEGILQPVTAAEAYLLSLVERMRDEAKEGLR